MQNVIDLPGVRPAPANDFSAVSRAAARPVQQPGATPVEPQPLLPQEAEYGLTKDIIPLVKPDIELPDNTEALADKTQGWRIKTLTAAGRR